MTAQTKTITVSSDAFKEGGAIPKKYSGEGENISPAAPVERSSGRRQGVGADRGRPQRTA